MTNRLAIAREAMRAAFQVRRSLSMPREAPVNPFDLSQSLGIDVWFMDTPSLEGMFTRSPDPRIILPAWNHRPFGRLCFSCAHELGHAQLEHGNRIDEYLDEPRASKDPQEMAADVFASSLLMPRPAVLRAFESRGTTPTTASSLQLLTVAFELAVGLETLVKHLRWGLDVIDDSVLKRYLKVSPKQIRREVFGAESPAVIVPVDDGWRSPSVDLEVGQAVARPSNRPLMEEASPLLARTLRVDGWDVYVARRPGVATIDMDGRRIPFRVARTGYVGAWQNRFLEDPEAT